MTEFFLFMECCKMSNSTKFNDGDMMYDDKGFRCYYDAELEDWIASVKHATQRFIDILNSRNDFEGFDEDADEDDIIICDHPYCKEKYDTFCDPCGVFQCLNHKLCKC